MDEQEIRKNVIIALIVGVGILFLGRLFYIQIIETTYQQLASDNVVRKKVVYPPRGLMYDRRGRLIVQNVPTYDIMVIPARVQHMDTTLFCALLDLTPGGFRERIQKARQYSLYRPSLFYRQLSREQYAYFQEHLYDFPGFFTRKRTVREYPHAGAAHVLGYIGEVGQEQIDASDYYVMGDYIGISGLEKAYEELLRGRKGVEYVLVDVHGRSQGSFRAGQLDSVAVEGKNLVTTLDIALQNYGEKLMQNKRGSIVAIEPATGEVLAMVSSPGYNPNLLVGRQRGENFAKLNTDTLKPLFNRPIMAAYPPGSVFKVLMALMGLQEEVITTGFGTYCPGGYHIRGLSIKCHEHRSAYNLKTGIQYSCNTYFCKVFRRVLEQKRFSDMDASFANWRQYVTSFGLGSRLDFEMEDQLPGLVPGPEYFNKIYGKGRWRAPTVLSLGIGQGELGVTPLQMANMMAAVANRGYYRSPHLVKMIGSLPVTRYKEVKLHHTSIDSATFEPVIAGMQAAVDNGTGWAARVQDIEVCGKTGTAENPHGEDHSIFSAFAPAQNPKIAISVYVENAGFGSVFAAPIAGLMIAKYLHGKIPKPQAWWEQRMLNANLIENE